MGNTCTISTLDCSRNNKDSSSSIIVLQANGEVLKIDRKVRAGELMLQFPQHFLCHASSILLRRKSKMIPSKTFLQRGKIYLLLPFPTDDASNSVAAAKDEQNRHQQNEPLLTPTRPPQGTTKFIMSKHYLDRILSENNQNHQSKPKKNSTKRCTTMPQKKSKKAYGSNSGPVQRRSSITWSPALDSIPESPLK